ncbi:MAG TPA: AraC family transcriptional regulator [Candidatus Blautia faecigallinarum]|uniref:AraC family transcriptional regulator n=1 Tax=Candidatus Blautia faecigallinarum TaxID=2838488 RepID=A0A9D2DU75_9FIRM|nr:AraC family transcriptional regulator [Candidatus Blautia faecigallinarum]
MQKAEKKAKIITDETLRETVSHGNEEYPFCYYLEDVWEFDLHCIDWHWHPEIEFVFVQKGTVTFLVGSERYVLTAGNGIFINSQILHRFEADETAVIPNIVFSPSLLSSKGSLIYEKYIEPVLHAPMDCLILSPDLPWQKTALDELLSVFSLQETAEPDELQTVQLLLKLWGTLYAHIPAAGSDSPSKGSAYDQARLQIMLQYIHANYPQPVSLDDIARTVTLSKSSVLHIFHQYLHISPVNYLIRYRLKRAARLLVSTESSIFSIAQSTGFESPGYFCRKFKELYQMTPGEYRKRKGDGMS